MRVNEVKFLCSLLMSILAIVLYLVYRGETRKRCMLGMVLSTAGDFFMVDILSLGGISTYPGAALFMLAHIVYAFAFIQAEKDKNEEYINFGFKSGLIFVLALTILLAILAFTVPDVPQTVMFFLILVYIAVIAFNLVSQFSYAANEKGGTLMLVFAMTLFLVSDFVIFLNMLAITESHNQLVWATYIPAQILITIFNSKLKKN